MSSRMALKIHSGLWMGRVFPLALSRNLMGRSLDASVSIDDLKVSRLHAAVDHVHGQFFVVDLGSTNGTYLNGRRVENRALLRPGDELRLGSATLRFEPIDVATQSAEPHWRETTRVYGTPRLDESEPEFLASKIKALETLRTWALEHRHRLVLGLVIGLTVFALIL